VDVPSGAKVELVFADSSITEENVFEKINAYSREGTTGANLIRRDGTTFADEKAFKKAFVISAGTDGVHVWPKRGSFCIRIQ
jgi:hypothetical protein